MLITKEDLIKNGIDPSLYDKYDMEAIGESADKIKNGQLSILLGHITQRFEREINYRTYAGKARNKLNEDLEQISKLLDSIIELCSSKKSVFASGLSQEETERILVGTNIIYNKISALKKDAYEHVGNMYTYVRELSEIQFIYSRKLYNAGMLNAAMAVIDPNDTRDNITNASTIAFDMLNDLTEFINDLTDRAVISEEAVDIKLPDMLGGIMNALDFNNDGASLNTKNAIELIYQTKQMIKDVIER